MASRGRQGILLGRRGVYCQYDSIGIVGAVTPKFWSPLPPPPHSPLNLNSPLERERARERESARERERETGEKSRAERERGQSPSPLSLFPRLSCCVNAYGDIIVETRPPTGKKFIEFS